MQLNLNQQSIELKNPVKADWDRPLPSPDRLHLPDPHLVCTRRLPHQHHHDHLVIVHQPSSLLLSPPLSLALFDCCVRRASSSLHNMPSSSIFRPPRCCDRRSIHPVTAPDVVPGDHRQMIHPSSLPPPTYMSSTPAQADTRSTGGT